MLAKSIVSSSILLLLVPNFASAAFTWIDDKKDAGFNCMGTVADAVCCKDSFCNANSEADCSKGTKQFLCSWTGTKCIPFRDDANNVCCQSEVKDACSKIVKGICPDNWQVPENCCSDLGKKWNGTLIGVKPGHVCCNAPCTEMQKAGCQLPDTCAPSQRSYGYNNPYNMLGFNYLATRPPKSVVLGNVLSGTGFGGDYATSLLDSVGSGKSKDQNVPEITVDDLMSLLIESLSDDKDAMVYNAEMNSDPYMGKTKSGGPVTSMNLPDPNIFLNMLYGSPFGASQGSLGDYPSAYDAYNPYSYMGMPSMTQQFPPQYPPQYPGMMPPQAYPQYPGMPQPFASQPPYQQINPYQPYQSPPPQQWQQPAPQPQWQQPAPQPQWQQPAPQPQWQQPAPQPQWQQPAPQPAPQPQWQQPTPAPQPQWQQPTPAPQPVPVAQPQPAPAPQPQQPTPQPTQQPTQAPPQPTQAPKSQQPWPQPAPQQQPAQQPWPPAQQPAQQPWPPAQQPWQQPAPPQQPGPIFKGQP